MESLCVATKNLKMNRLLLVDVLNYNNKFFGLASKATKPYRSLSIVYQIVKQFVSAARRGGWDMEVFIDDVIKTNEGEAKWKKRREEESIEIFHYRY